VLMVFTPKESWPLHAKHPVPAHPHLQRFPPREVFLQIAITASLRKESVRREDEGFLRGDPFHVVEELLTILLGEVFDQVKGNNAIELSGSKHSAKILRSPAPELVMRAVRRCLLERRPVSLETYRILEGEHTNR
jgi:hypothetical protein